MLLRGRDTALGAYANQDLPFDQVVDAVGPVRSLSRNPLFGVVVHVRDELPADQVIDATPDGERSPSPHWNPRSTPRMRICR